MKRAIGKIGFLLFAFQLLFCQSVKADEIVPTKSHSIYRRTFIGGIDTNSKDLFLFKTLQGAQKTLTIKLSAAVTSEGRETNKINVDLFESEASANESEVASLIEWLNSVYPEIEAFRKDDEAIHSVNSKINFKITRRNLSVQINDHTTIFKNMVFFLESGAPITNFVKDIIQALEKFK